ncbi:MAG: RluA family pseudouridine synthase [Sphaerochaeta sp.]
MRSFKERILYEDNHLLLVNKKCGELAQGDESGDLTLGDMAKEYLRVTYNKQGNIYLGIPHRLDRPTSGVVVLAKTEKALIRLNTLFREDKVDKTYWAIVDKAPPHIEGTLINNLVKDAKSNKSRAFAADSKKGKKAVLHYHHIASSKNFHLLAITLETGRHHQIRAQLASIGLHIRGDLKYGYPRSNRDGGISLHARSISFIHPVKQEQLTIIAPVPNDPLWNVFEEMAQ